MDKHEDFEYIKEEYGNFSFILDTGKRKDFITPPKVKKWVKTITHYGDKVYGDRFIKTDKRYKKYQELKNLYKENHKNLIPELPEILKIYDVVFPSIEKQWQEN